MKNASDRIVLLLLVAFCSCLALAQGSAPSVAVQPVEPLTVTRGGHAPLNVVFQVNRGFHVNSHKPNDELLLPTTLQLELPQGVSVVNIQYPEGEQLSVPFLGGEKLSVYSGVVTVSAQLRVARTVAVGTQRVHATVKYQACDNRQCFPPKTVPFDFDVKVVATARR